MRIQAVVIGFLAAVIALPAMAGRPITGHRDHMVKCYGVGKDGAKGDPKTYQEMLMSACKKVPHTKMMPMHEHKHTKHAKVKSAPAVEPTPAADANTTTDTAATPAS